ncbi:MAG: T9SS type A sorting domain-containing protein [Bacteroidota bacterium]|nr:T9SS type A sorting domain-containing protein [Bacteroidota bacterium]
MGKKIFSILLILFFALNLSAQTNNKKSDIYHAILSHSTTMYNNRGGSSTFTQKITPIFPDTTAYEMFGNRPQMVVYHGIGAVLDTKYPDFDRPFSNLNYTLDSVYITAYYVVKKPKIVDTLQLEVIYGNSNSNDTANNPFKFITQKITSKTTGKFAAPKYVGNKKLGTKGGLISINKFIKKYPIDSAGTVKHVVYRQKSGYDTLYTVNKTYKLPVNINIPAGNIVGALITFIPGDTSAYTLNDLYHAHDDAFLKQTRNSFSPMTWEQKKIDSIPTPIFYNASTYGLSYVLLKEERFLQPISAYSADFSNTLFRDVIHGYYIDFVITTDFAQGIKSDNNSNVISFKNYPNPAGESTIITYEITNTNNVNLIVTDISGKQVKSIDLGRVTSGVHNFTLNTSDLNNGVYFYTLVCKNERLTGKMTVIRE